MVYWPKREWCGQTVCLALFAGIWVIALAGQVPPGNSWFQVFRTLFWTWLGFYIFIPFFATSYEITDAEVIVRWGIRTTRIPLSSIFAIEPSRGEWGMPAWSSDSLKIRYHTNRVVGSHIVIAPLDKAGFLAELEKRAPNLRSAPKGARANDRELVASAV